MTSTAVDTSRFSRLARDTQDGDVWCERVTVCETATKTGQPKLILRSYYRNRRTDERVWDEPPSGASRVKHATAEMRARGEQKLQELRLTLDMIPNEHNSGMLLKKKKKRGFFGLFQRKDRESVEDSKDLNLQKAIALSMSNRPEHFRDYDNAMSDDSEDLALARALSLSASEY